MDLQLRPARLAECALIAEHLREFGNDARHNRRQCQAQEADEGVLLIAWLGEMPVGRLWLRWSSCPEIPRIKGTHPVAATLGPCPSFGEIEVSSEHRGRGIGTQLIQHAERLARERGFRRASLTAEHDGRPRQLYERLGYADPGIGVFHTSGTYIDEDGRKVQWDHGEQVLLVKEL